MNNPTGASDVALTVFGGAVPEMSPEDLPEGASPWCQDTDYSPGKVFTRGGLQNQLYYQNTFFENLTGRGQSLPGKWAPNESPWTNPNNITLNIPGTYAETTLTDSGSTPVSSTSVNSTLSGTGGGVASVVIPATTVIGDAILLAVATTGNFAVGTTDNFGNVPEEEESRSDANGSVIFFYIDVEAAGGGYQITVNFGGSPAHYWYAGVVLRDTSGAAPFPTFGLSSAYSGVGLVGTAFVTASAPGAFIVELGCTMSKGLVSPSDGSVSAVTTGLVSGGSAAVSTLHPTSSGTLTAQWNNSWFNELLGGPAGCVIVACFKGTGSGGGFKYSQVLQADTFAFSIPSTASIMGIQFEVFGHQSVVPGKTLNLKLNLISPSVVSPTMTFQLPSVDGEVILGAPISNWGLALTPALLNNPNFGAQIVAYFGGGGGGGSGTFDIYAVKLKVWVNLNPANVNWIKTYEQTDGEIDTLALDATGVLWDEDVDTNPGALLPIFTAIEPNTFAKSVTFDDTEFIAFSDLSNGTDVPRLWNGQWLDRVSQVGPGAPPSVATTASGSAIVSITQNAPTTLLTGAHDFTLVSAAPSAHGTFGTPSTPGNVMTIVPRTAFIGPAYFKVGSNIQISGFPSINGNNVNNDPAGVFNPAFYTITSVGQPVPGQQAYDWITFQVPFTTFYAQPTTGGCNIQATIATLTAAQQVPFLEVGNQFTVAGGTVAGWDNTFVVQATPNASQLSVTQTSLTSNVAQYVFTLITGVVPVVGQFVTVTGTLNGNGIFNVSNAVITAASPTNFSIALVNPGNISAAPETGNGIISGTIFQFDPVGVVTNPIVGNSTGGTISTSGVLGVGTRSCVVIFQTRNGALTAPSPPVQFTITAAASAIVVSQIPVGPPNVSARILAFTGANGGNYFYIPTPVMVTSNGQNVTYPATLINDNTTTQVTLSFPDAVLLAATAIDVQGNNLFEQIELGSSVGFTSYSSRLIAWGEQNKIQNLLNLSFDGGVGVQSTGIISSYPLGWTVDPTNGGGGQLNVSPIFGNSYYVKNVTGSTQTIYGMIEQGAYQDQFQQPIINTNTPYSVRVTARCPSQVGSGTLVMDLFSPKLNQVFGSFGVPLASMATTMNIFTGTLLTTNFSTVPKDLLYRIYVTNLLNNGDVELDRTEPFPTLEPVLSTQFRASYANNPEAFDDVTGGFGPDQNQQPIRGGMTLFDTLYALKTSSWFSTSDNGNTEPDLWTWREVSNKIGTIGSHSFDYGEEWAFSACRAGVYLFTGGEPLKVSQEIAPVWDLINWKYGQSIWLRNDPEQRKVYVGIPIPTPNMFMPEFPVNTNPTLPNVILMMSYRELNSGMAIADTPPIRSSFSGRILAPEPARKWSFWNVQSPYADFINRANNTNPLFVCSGTANSKVYAFVDSELDDDGLPVNGYYITYGAVKPDMQDAKGLGSHRMLLQYLTILAEGFGNLNPLIYTQSPLNVPYTLSSIPLSQFTLGDLEAVVNLTGERFFLRVGTNAVGAKFQMSKVVFSLLKDAWSQVRGTATANQ